MKQMRRGLLMILIMALAMPSPAVMAESENPVVDNTTETVEVVQPVLEAPPAAEVLPAEPVAAQDTVKPTSPSDGATLPIHTPAIPTEPQSNPPTTVSSAEVDNPPAQSPQTPATDSRVIISKINPDQPEIVEIYNSGDKIVNLADLKMFFVDSEGKQTILKEFSQGEIMPGQFLVIGDNQSIEFNDKTQNKIKLDGKIRLTLLNYEYEVDFSKGSELSIVKKKSGERFLQRCSAESPEFIIEKFSAELLGKWPNCQDNQFQEVVLPNVANNCDNLLLNEIGVNIDEQFIEVKNTGVFPLNISGCKLTTKHSKGLTYSFESFELSSNAVFSVKIKDTKLRLNRRTSGDVSLLDPSGDKIDEIQYAKLAEKTSFALIDGEWLQTYSTTPGESNVFKEFPDCKDGYVRDSLTNRCRKMEIPKLPKTCPVGQYLNPETGRCKKIEVVKAPAPCKEGYYRSEETGRCRSITATVAKALKPCRDDEFRNPATGRCKKIAAASDILKECPEGFERNPATKRCRKIKSNIIPAVNFAPEKVQQVASATWGWWVFGGVSLLAMSIAGWQWRWEISRATRKITSVFTKQRR